MRSCSHWRSGNCPRRARWSWRRPRLSPSNCGAIPRRERWSSSPTSWVRPTPSGTSHLLVAETGYRVVVVEPLAIGTSSRPKQADYSLSAQALRVAAVLDSCGVRLAIVAGQGTNAAVAVRLAAARPDEVARLVLLEGGGSERAAGPGFRRAMQNSAGLQFFPGLMRAAIRKGMISASGDASWVTDEVVYEYTRGAASDLSATLDAYRAIAKAKEPSAIADQLRQGARAGATAARRREAFGRPAGGGDPHAVAGLPGMTIDTVTGAGHHLAEERPDRVVEALIGEAAVAAAVPRRPDT